MSKKPVPIDLVPHMHLIRGSREFLRVWAQEGGPVTCFINPVPVGGDPMAFGIALVDCVRHGAKTWARAVGISEAEAEARIWEGIDAERANPTDIATEYPATQDDGLIH
jgi:Domain of unknown function (DUF5076)